jgi:hypothetical protein
VYLLERERTCQMVQGLRRGLPQFDANANSGVR